MEGCSSKLTLDEQKLTSKTKSHSGNRG